MSTSAEVLARFAHILGVASYQEMADRLGVSKSAVANWHSRGSIPYDDCVREALARGISLDWLLAGRGPKHFQDNPAPPSVDDTEELRSLARLSSVSRRWRVMGVLMQGASTEQEVAERTGFDPADVRGCLLLLAGEKLAVEQDGRWRLPEDPPVLVSRDIADTSGIAAAGLDFLRRDVISRLGEADVLILVAAARVANPRAGRKLMSAFCDSIRETESDVDQDSTALRVVIGIAPLPKTG